MSAVTDWIGSLGAAIGGVGTAGALIYAARAYGRQVKDSREDQANRISAWPTTDQDSGRTRTVIRVANTSGRAVYDFKVVVTDPKLNDTAMVTRPDGGMNEAAAGYALLPPSDGAAAFAQPGVRMLLDPDEALVTIAFRDQAGRYWRRNARGVLTEISADEAAEVKPTAAWPSEPTSI